MKKKLTPYVIGIDIGGTNLRIGAVTSDYQLHNCKKVSSRKMLTTSTPLETLQEFIEHYMEEQKDSVCLGICIGFPGTVAQDKHHVYSCPNLPSLSNINIGTPLSNYFNIPVIAEHDVILLLANDMIQKDIQHFNTIIALYIGTGLGNALFINGKFLTGKNGVSGELGHIPVSGSSRECPCGNRGCLELHCAGKRLEEIQKQHYPDIPLNDIFLHFSSDSPLSEYLDYLAIAAATEINILDPDCILLSGGVINMTGFPIEYLKNRIYHYTRKPYPAQNLSYVTGTTHPFGGVLGAGIYLWNSSILKQK